MKIAIVGTSNSILANGYASLYEAIEYPNQVDNFSIGATICQYIPFALEKYSILQKYDFLITDSCPNDSDCYFCKQRSADWFYNELYTIFSNIKETQIKHLHLIFPYARTNILQKIHVQICEELAIPYLDLGTLLSPSAEQTEQDLMQDIHHVSPFFAKQIAWLIKQKKEKIFAAQDTKSAPLYKTKEYIFYDLTKKFQKEYPIITRASSHISEQFIQLEAPQELTLTNLPALNLEGLYFYTNKEAGFFNLTSQNSCNNYSLYFPTADYIFYQPIPQNTFAIDDFLKIQAGYTKKARAFLMENNPEPPHKDSSTLMLNSLLLSKELRPVQAWKEETFPARSEDKQCFEPIHNTLLLLAQNKEITTPISPEILLIGASLYPKNTWLRKELMLAVKKTENPYYCYYFVQYYLMPRRKYNMAIKLLEKAIERKSHIPFIQVLVSCYLEKKLFAKALALITKKMPAQHIITYRLFCELAVAMQNEELFFQSAQKILACNTHINYLLFLASSCIKFNALQEAIKLLNTAFEEQRNFRPDNMQENMDKINKLTQEIQKQSQT